MESTNDFSRGMQSDISRLIQAKNTYLEAINFRPFTELGGSNTSLVTIKGNSCGVNFPNMNGIYKLKIDIKRPTFYADTIDIDISGVWGTDSINAFVVNENTMIVTLYQAIIALPNYGTKYLASYGDDYIMIYQSATTSGCESDIDQFTVNVTENTVPTTQNTIWFIGPNNSFYSSGTTLWPDNTPYITAGLNPLIPIGYTTILEDIYLFVAEDDPTYTDIYPTGSGIPSPDNYDYPGYIFKLQYDETSDTTTLTLIYAAYLNFTKYAPIAPSAAIGRYESDVIQRIYWSDFYNKVKTLNVGDPQLMALNPQLAGVVPSVNYDIPILNEIITGSLLVGTYELCYRLKQSLGAVSNYSPISNMVQLINSTLSSFIGYEGTVPGNNSGKGIRWNISNIDTNFDRIEYIVLFRDSATDVAKVYSYREDNIPSNGVIQVDVTSLADAEEILLTDFLAIQSSFTHAKTVDTKDNRLFWGNVKVRPSSLDTWDSRAFRAVGNTAPTWNDIILTNNGVTSTFTLAAAQALSETEDCINEYYDNTGGFSANACYYKPGTAILGGQGANISYEFGTYSIQLNTLNRTTNSDAGYNIYNDLPFRECDNINPAGSFAQYDLIGSPDDSPNQIYPIRTIGSMKNPYRCSVIKGFQHEEIYRFGIQFFDLEGIPMFVKWIGDIKMPTYGDPNPNPDSHAAGAGVTDFRITYQNGTETYGQILYIKFDVNVTGLESFCSGYRIVRMARDSAQNKTILGCGLITPTFTEAANTNLYLPACFNLTNTAMPTPLGPVANRQIWYSYPDQPSWETLSVDTGLGDVNNQAEVKTFDSFDFTATGGNSFSSGDRILLRTRLRSYNYQSALALSGQGYRWWDYSNGNGGQWYEIGAGPPTTYRVRPQSNLAPAINAFNAAVGFGATVNYQTGLDTSEMAYYMHMYIHDADFVTTSTIGSATYNRALEDGAWVAGNTTVSLAGGKSFSNYGRAFGLGTGSERTAIGATTFVMKFDAANRWSDDLAPYSCNASVNGGKLLALYYRPNNSQYGGNTYSARAGNEYIACGSYIPLRRDNLSLTNNLSLTIDVFGGDVHLDYWDHQKTSKNTSDATAVGPTFHYYSHALAIDANSPGGPGTITTGTAHNSVTYFFPCTSMANQEVRFGDHINTSLNTNTYYLPDENFYASYHTNESNVVKYYSEPLDFVETDKWINRVYYSEVKVNNETTDSWQVYKTNNFYDVEGNYGNINALVAFQGNLYYIQERGFGILYVNPMTAVTSDNNVPVVLGLGSTIQRHNYIKLDVGTMHQWSVFRSPDSIAFIDSRHKSMYLFNGQSLEPVSDTKGQRNFFIKRFHPELILRDNPIINKGVHTTYDYYHKEYIITFNNYDHHVDDPHNEQFTIAYSEPIQAFSSLYTFNPKIYFNNNRYILSFDELTNSFYVHNVGDYATFYGTLNESSIKLIVNDNPKKTKIFDSISWDTESIKDNVEWLDDINTPFSNPIGYSDNVNYLDDTFQELRVYNEYQNSDWVTLAVTNPITNLRRVEQSWNVQVPRNKVDYDSIAINTASIFDPTVLTKTTFGERMRDKYMVVDLNYDNVNNNRFIVHNLRTNYRISDR